MPKHTIIINQNGEEFETLTDILPEKDETLQVLFIAKYPPTEGVDLGHYFVSTKQGNCFWKMMTEYDLIDIPSNGYGDDVLLNYRYGMLDLVKKPRPVGEMPTDSEFVVGYDKLQQVLEKFKPKLIVFMYKGVLTKILELLHYNRLHARYGFNNHLEHLWNCKLFVFPLPGSQVTKDETKRHMIELKKLLDRMRH